MHLSMSSPTYPRSGRGGDCWGFANARMQNPQPWGQLRVTNPLLIIPGITTVWKSTDIRVANAPTLGTSLGDKSPPASRPGVGGA